MADKLLTARGGKPIGKNWARRFISRADELKTAFNRAKGHQIMRQENPETINAWFQLVRGTVEKFGLHLDDIHNFDKTGF
jgi:hypothetical protein